MVTLDLSVPGRTVAGMSETQETYRFGDLVLVRGERRMVIRERRYGLNDYVVIAAGGGGESMVRKEYVRRAPSATGRGTAA